MKITFRNLAYAGAVALSVVAVGMGCTTASKSGSRTAGQKADDRRVEKAVAKALAEDPTYKFTDVEASVFQGNVQLSGFVETPPQRLRAAERAATAAGARQVINDIVLKPTPTGPAVIRDRGGPEGSRLLMDTTNAPPAGMRHDSSLPTAPQPQENERPTGEGTNPNP